MVNTFSIDEHISIKMLKCECAIVDRGHGARGVRKKWTVSTAEYLKCDR